MFNERTQYQKDRVALVAIEDSTERVSYTAHCLLQSETRSVVHKTYPKADYSIAEVIQDLEKKNFRIVSTAQFASEVFERRQHHINSLLFVADIQRATIDHLQPIAEKTTVKIKPGNGNDTLVHDAYRCGSYLFFERDTLTTLLEDDPNVVDVSTRNIFNIVEYNDTSVVYYPVIIRVNDQRLTAYALYAPSGFRYPYEEENKNEVS